MHTEKPSDQFSRAAGRPAKVNGQPGKVVVVAELGIMELEERICPGFRTP